MDESLAARLILYLFLYSSPWGLFLLYSYSAAGNPTTTTTIIEGRLVAADTLPYNTTTRITLNNDEYTTYSRVDGSFSIYNVKPGVHQLDIHSTTHHFGQIKIQLLPESMDQPKCLEYAYPGAPKAMIPYPLVLTAHATYQYFEKRAGLSIFGLLKNPMVLMMIVSAGLMFLMPRMMEGLDPEEKAKMRKQMETQQDPTKMLSQMWGDLAGTKEEAQPKQKQRRVKKE
jgi:hypothetical protein